MSLKNIHWGKALLGLLLCYVIMVAAAFGWVAVYSHAINPGQPLAHYQAYANVASPWAALSAGVPAFFLVAWWLARKTRENPRGTVGAMFVIYVVLESAVVLSVPNSNLSLAFMAGNFLLKGLACALGCWFAERQTRAA